MVTQILLTFLFLPLWHDNAFITMPNVTGIYISVCLASVCLTPTNYFTHKSSAGRDIYFLRSKQQNPFNGKMFYYKQIYQYFKLVYTVWHALENEREK